MRRIVLRIYAETGLGGFTLGGLHGGSGKHRNFPTSNSFIRFWSFYNGTGLGTCVFLIPGHRVKIGEDRLIVLNRVAKSVIDEIRMERLTSMPNTDSITAGALQGHVFTYRCNPVGKMNNTAWKNARKRARLEQVRVHDLKHYSEFRIIPSSFL